jgi:4-hydroxyacetophenone monooxygenase
MTEEAFVRRAVEQGDINAIRMALYQATGDPEIAAIETERTVVRGGQGTQVTVAADKHERLRDLAVSYLMSGAADHVQTPPGDDEIDRLIQMAEAQPVDPHLLSMRRTLLSFSSFQHAAAWTDGSGPPALPEDFYVLIIGAGFSGIAMGVQLEALGIPYKIAERRPEIGGVWSVNTYPDARVDTLSSTYEFGFEKNYPWTEYFARQAEVRTYLEHIATKYGLKQHILFEHDVKVARFDEAGARWHLDVTVNGRDELTMQPNIVISAAGLFATPRKLDVPGVDDFRGELLHTTQWNGESSAKGKRVAVVGNGSTGVQLLAQIASEAEHVDVFQRTPQWISPRERYGQPRSAEVRWLLENLPWYWNWSRYVAVMPLLDARELLVPDEQWRANGGHVNPRSDMVREGLAQYAKSQLGDRDDLLEQLIPDYAPIARRPVVDNNWYKTLTLDHVELVSTPIERIDENAIRTADGRSRDVDMIIAAVGFETGKYLWPTEYHGTNGTTLEDVWSEEGAKAYLGIAVPNFPNLFMMYGPNSQPVSGGAGLPTWFEIWSRYIGQSIVMMLESHCSRMEVRKDVYDDYNDRLQREASKLIYIVDTQSRDKNYYVNEFGRLQVNFPWEAEDFYQMVAAPNTGDYIFS